MKIKVLLFLVAVITLSSCNHDDDEDETNIARFGYLEGNIGDSYVNISNTDDHRDSIHAAYRVYCNDLEIAIWGVQFNPSPSTLSRLHIRLCSLHRGTYVMKKTLNEVALEPSEYQYINNAVEYERKTKDESVLYGPKKDKPFLVNITDVRYDPMDMDDASIVEGYMNGVLYNRENPSDSIVVDHVRFGFH